MLKNMEQLVNHKFGEKLDDVAIAIMKRDFMVTEVSQSCDGAWKETELAMIVDGVEMTMKLSHRVGF